MHVSHIAIFYKNRHLKNYFHRIKFYYLDMAVYYYNLAN
jgi:hypothetical protein